jgi:ABC-2 type transport system ATP-binding protein
MTQPILSIRDVSKRYASGQDALKNVSLDIMPGEIFALLGPNGAGKTTLINIICGIVTLSSGIVTVDGSDIVRNYRAARTKIGLVPQELLTDAFETVVSTVRFSRGLFGKKQDRAFMEKTLRQLTLWDKRNTIMRELSGGMKRRVMIAKALAHEPEILFLDEPSAGVDVELRRDMWQQIRTLRESGVTVILTTHYIEEAEMMADRVGVINNGELILVEEKNALMKKLGRKLLTIKLAQPLESVPSELAEWNVQLKDHGCLLAYEFDAKAERTGIPTLLARMRELEIGFTDLDTQQSSLEDIFVSLVSNDDRVEA